MSEKRCDMVYSYLCNHYQLKDKCPYAETHAVKCPIKEKVK